MYIDCFINKKYIALLRYCININKNNSIVVDLKYDTRNKMLFLRKFSNKFYINTIYLRKFLLKIRKRYQIILSSESIIQKYNTTLKKSLSLSLKKLKKARMPLIYNKLKKSKWIKALKLKLSNFKIKEYKRIQGCLRPYSFISANTNLHKFFKKIRLLRFLVHRLLHNQVLGNALLFDGFLSLNLHPLFLKRFKYHFLIFTKEAKIKRKFNFNNFNYFFVSKLFSKLLKFGSLVLYLRGVAYMNCFFNKLYFNSAKKLLKLLTFKFNYKYLNKYKNYMSNLCNINYIKTSFKLTIFKRKNKRKIRRYLRKFKKMNFFIFYNLIFFKLVFFLFLFWFNNFIVLFDIKSKGNMLSAWFKSVGFVFKKYIWRKKPRRFYLKYNDINNYIFLNYKNRVIKMSYI